jgi:lipopolysaccharide export system protein LptA
MTFSSAYTASSNITPEKKTIIITSKTLTADNKNNTAVFEGSVVAKTGDITMHSDKMAVFYDKSENNIDTIHATGNVKVHKNERALFSDKAVYFDADEKIVFTGNPKAIEGNNVISGTKIIFYFRDDRAVVEGSKVILQNKEGIKQ